MEMSTMSGGSATDVSEAAATTVTVVKGEMTSSLIPGITPGVSVDVKDKNDDKDDDKDDEFDDDEEKEAKRKRNCYMPKKHLDLICRHCCRYMRSRRVGGRHLLRVTTKFLRHQSHRRVKKV